MDLIQKLPEDIRRHIIPYTYMTQKADVLLDIIQFHTTLDHVTQVYKNQWSPSNVNDWADWLINDIFAWLNDNVPTILGYRQSFHNVWNRFPLFKNDAVINLRVLERKNPITQVRVFWGLLTPTERKHFITCPSFLCLESPGL